MEALWHDSEELKTAVSFLDAGEARLDITGALTPALASFLGAVFSARRSPVVMILPDMASAVRWSADMAFFLSPDSPSQGLAARPSAEPHIRDDSSLSVVVFPELSGEGAPSDAGIFKSHLAASMYALASREHPISIVPAGFLATRHATPSEYFSERILIKQNETISVSRLVRKLPEMGYERVHRVEREGEFSFRGGILDIHIPVYKLPVRFEFFGDEVVSIREFDPLTQRSVSRVREAGVLPARRAEAEDASEPVMARFTQWFGADAASVWIDPDGIFRRIRDVDASLDPEALETWMPARRRIFCDVIEKFAPGDPWRITLKSEAIPRFQSRYPEFVRRLRDWLDHQYRIRIVYRRETIRRFLKERIADAELESGFRETAATWIEPGPRFVPGKLSGGFVLPDKKWVFLAESDIIGERKKQAWRKVREEPGLSFKDLTTGDYIVHIDHGIGIYQGLKQLVVEGHPRDFLQLEYAGGQKLYLPVERLELIQRYIGTGEQPPQLDRLGGVSFRKKKQRVRESALKLAAELLKLFSQREVARGFAFPPDDRWQREFEMGFEYEETPDQMRAIEDVKSDMERVRPMDRLVCGDVGYGKTEVAMRAAFKAANAGKQVCVLVPTTILAQQHFHTFVRRFRAFPVHVAMLSRFLKSSDARRVREGLAGGAVDIVIGTHALLSDKISFKNLGLVIIDEEQRFGVRHKEKLKALRTQVDVLTLTATPIPRTLNMALLGLRDISLINTPPEARKPVITRIVRFDLELIRQAVLSEIQRGGQVFFVHNRVRSIYALGELLRKLLPEITLEIAHGQMRESQLEKIMMRFSEREFDLLLSTTIIESGLDIPSVNTIIINRADRLGLAQLYQLRGRVGRDRYQAYAYLLTPASSAVSATARKRLAAIREALNLGAGYQLASRDLEIRGAGDIVGPNQHGHIAAIGYELYCRMIRDAIKELKGEPSSDFFEPDIRLKIDTTIPETFIANPAERLDIYRRFATARKDAAIDDILEEIADRFGEAPETIRHLAEVSRLKNACIRCRVRKVEQTGAAIALTFSEDTPVKPEKITGLLMSTRRRIRFTPPSTLTVELGDIQFASIPRKLRTLLDELA